MTSEAPTHNLSRSRGDQVIRIGAKPLSVEDLCDVAGGAKVDLTDEAVATIEAGRAVVDALVSGETPIYGLNTGLGHLRNERVSVELLRDYQIATVKMHSGGIGPPLPPEIVRAAMCTRIAGIARGGAGASRAVAETLVRMLNAGVHPVVPLVGSVGASDLMHMAAIAMVAIGLGFAELNGEALSGAEAMARAGIEPLQMQPKDGLALVSANGVSIGHGALVVSRAEKTMRLIDVSAALSLEAVRGNPSVVEPVVAAAKPIPGQIESGAHIRALLAGSSLCTPGGPGSVQDPLSFRVVPQVHGAVRELVAFARKAVEDELASMDDNPLVVARENRMVSNGNFHPMLMALSFEALRPGLAHAGQIIDRRVGHHFDTLFADPDWMIEDAGVKAVESVGSVGILRYAAAARYTELRQLASPVTLDIPSLDLAVEDHATNAPLTVRRTQEALDLVDDLVAVELLTADAVLRHAGDPAAALGTGTSAALEALKAVVSALPAGASGDQVHHEVVARLPDLLMAAEQAIA